jgi:hypothetical protein
LCNNFDKKRIGLHLGQCLNKRILVTQLVSRNDKITIGKPLRKKVGERKEKLFLLQKPREIEISEHVLSPHHSQTYLVA